MADDTPEIQRNNVKLAVAISAAVVLVVLGIVYMLLIWQPTPNKTVTQTIQQKVTREQPKEVKAVDQELQQTEQSLDADLDTTDLNQDIDALL